MVNDLSLIKNKKALAWIKEQIALCTPDKVHVMDGSIEEINALNELLVQKGTFLRLNPEKRPNCFYTRTNPGDTARVEAATFICSKRQEDAGPTNNWMDPVQMKKKLHGLMKGCMKGRIMYVIPFSMGPTGGKISRIGIEITDSGFVAANMRIMTRVGTEVLKVLGTDGDFVPAFHSVISPLEPGQKDIPWPCNLKNRYIVQFPETHEIISVGSGYGGNSLLGKKCFALRIATVLSREEGRSLAEHMLVLGITNPEGKKHYITAAFPSACGKTNLAMMNCSLPGWKVTVVGDDIAWMKLNKDGRLYAINPESGFFGVAPGTSEESNPNALRTCERDCIFTNVALTTDGDVWWKGLTDQPPANAITWKGKKWTRGVDDPKELCHPNSRFTADISNCPVVDDAYFNSPDGVPVDAIIFGGRRESVVPLVFQSRDWNHGVLLGSSVASERTAAAEGKMGELRFDPFAMLPFCGYNMADYFAHWLSFPGKTDPAKLPKIFHVNWFRKENGKFLWPGYGDNSRVLKWICERCDDVVGAIETPIGYLPAVQDLDLTGLDIDLATMKKLLYVDCKAYLDEVEKIRKYHSMFGSKYPKQLTVELDNLEKRLKQQINKSKL